MQSDFLIVTPVINASKLFYETFQSILEQEGLGTSFTVKYIIADAGNTNNSEIDYVNEVLQQHPPINGLEIIHLKYNDKSMYDGLANALKSNTTEHEVFAYINAGDLFSPYSFITVLETVKSSTINENEFWFTGCTGSYNERGRLYKLIEPVAYPTSLIRAGIFGRFLPYVQQESTFFSYKLVKRIDLNQLASFKYAGDFYLWKSISDMGVKLDIIPIWLAGFREHQGQLSSVYNKEYKSEMLSICDKVGFFSLIKSLVILFFHSIHPRLRCERVINLIRGWK